MISTGPMMAVTPEMTAWPVASSCRDAVESLRVELRLVRAPPLIHRISWPTRRVRGLGRSLSFSLSAAIVSDLLPDQREGCRFVGPRCARARRQCVMHVPVFRLAWLSTARCRSHRWRFFLITTELTSLVLPVAIERIAATAD